MSDVTVRLDTEKTEISGTIPKLSGDSRSDLAVFVFPVDPALRIPGGWRVQGPIRGDVSGQFGIVGLPPGAYLIGLLADVATSALVEDSAFEAVGSFVKIELSAGEKKKVALQVK